MAEIQIDGHPIPQLEGNGNCGECVFNGSALALGIAPRDVVGVEWSEDSGATWRRRYTGIAVQTGSPQNSGISGFKLVGLLKKLEEAEVRVKLEKGDLGGQVQTLLTAIIASGQTGNLFDPVLVKQAVPAITSGAILPNYQSASVILKEKLCPRLLNSRVSVNENRQVVFGVPSGTLLVDEATEGVTVDWQDVTSEELVTDVRFQWSTGLSGTFYVNQRPVQVGSPPIFTRLLHTTEFLTAPGADNWPFGHGVRQEGVTLDKADFDPVVPTQYNFNSFGDGLTTTGDTTSLSDTDVATSVTLQASFAANVPYIFGVQMSVAGGQLPDAILLQSDATALLRMTILVQNAGFTVCALDRFATVLTSSGVLLFPDDIRDAVAAFTADTLLIILTLQADAGSLMLYTCCPASVGSTITGTARSMAKLPVPAAGVLTLPGWIDPQPTVQIQRRGENGEDLGIVTLPGTLFGYEPTGFAKNGSAIGLQTTIQLGQPDTADVLGDAALIKARDRKATMTAISVAS